MKAPEKLTLLECEQAIGEPAETWEARCHEIASKLVIAKLVDGVAVYGHFRGRIARASRFYRSSGGGFVQHGWIALADGRVLDPTRWTFEGKDPYLYLGPSNADYDEGGNVFRASMRKPPPKFDLNGKVYVVPSTLLPTGAWKFAKKYLRLDYSGEQKPGFLGTMQLAYLANAPLADLGEHAAHVYHAIEKLGCRGFIPIDNLKRVQSGRWSGK